MSKNGPKSVDNFGNTVYTTSIKQYKSIKCDWQSNKNGDVLKKIARVIEENISLITNIEYSVRKILPVHTEKYLKNALNYFEYCASCISLMKNDTIGKNQLSMYLLCIFLKLFM